MALLQTDCMLTCNIIFFSNLLLEHSSKSSLKYLLEKLLDKWYSCYLHQLKNILPLFTIFLILHIENKEKNTVTMVNYHYTALPPSHLPRNLRILLFNTNWKEVHCRKAGRNPKCSFKTGKKKRSIAVYIYIFCYLSTTSEASDMQLNFPCFQWSHIQRSLQAVARSLCHYCQHSPQGEMQKYVNAGIHSHSL